MKDRNNVNGDLQTKVWTGRSFLGKCGLLVVLLFIGIFYSIWVVIYSGFKRLSAGVAFLVALCRK
jgi:hypothetical protein